MTTTATINYRALKKIYNRFISSRPVNTKAVILVSPPVFLSIEESAGLGNMTVPSVDRDHIFFGTARIQPDGKLDDHSFEVVIRGDFKDVK